ncbi:hypothetical protein [Nocardia sp. NPDC051832]|uniref:nSTAND1 domain-containing NTPase n=1 Tax=Nocardia sp. NPDC051832 TaxID=3155673 RepID=UPI00342D75C8
MSDGLEFFSIALGMYDHFEQIDVAAEVEAIADILSAFDGHHVDWDVEMAHRGHDAVNARLSSWSASNRPTTVLYWAGHGWSNGEYASLAHARSPKDVQTQGIKPDRIADAIADRGGGDAGSWVVVIVDACRSKKFIVDLKAEILKHSVGETAYLLVGGLSGEGATELGRVSEILRYILEVTCAQDYEVDLATVAAEFERHHAEVETKWLAGRALRRRHAAVINVPLDARNELEAALDALTADELSHFLPKAHGGELPFHENVLVEQSWYFVGRDSETQYLIDWFADSDQGMLVVTGPAGSGKSALLGNLVVQSNPSLRTALLRAGILDECPAERRPPDQVFDMVVHLTGATPEDVVARIAHGAELADPPKGQIGPAIEWLVEQLRTRRVTILIDALDEAVDPLTAARVLRAIAACPSCRVVVGTRASTHDDPDHTATDTNLLDALGPATRLVIAKDRSAVHRYVTIRLRRAARLGVLASPLNIDALAAAVRQLAPHFLFARLLVHELLADADWHDPDTWDRLLNSNHRELFGIAVARLTRVQQHSRRPMLEALAFGRGRGVPEADDIWATLTKALAPSARVDRAVIDELLVDAAPYILADREYDQTVYRLAHRTFTEYFTDDTTPSDQDRSKHLAITHALAERTVAAASGVFAGTRTLNPYFTHAMSGHAAIAGAPAWQLLDSHHNALASLDPETVARDVLRSAFGRIDLPPAIGGILTFAEQLQHCMPTDRPLALQLAAARHSVTYRANRAEHNPGAVQLIWAALYPRRPHRVLTGHTGPVWTVTAVKQPDATVRLATGSDDSTIRLWDPITGDPVGQPLTGHTDAVLAATAVPVGGRPLLATGSRDATVRLWDAGSGEAVGKLVGHSDWVLAVSAVVLHDGRPLLVSGSADNTVRLWDPESGRQIRGPLTGHTDSVLAVTALPLPDGRIVLASTGLDGTVRLWDPMTGKQIGQPMTGHTGWVWAIESVPLPDGRTLLATGSQDNDVRLWDPATGKGVGKPLTGHTGWVLALATTPAPDGRTLLAAGSDDRTVRLWDPITGDPVGQPLTGHTDAVLALAAASLPDGRTLLATGCQDNAVRLVHPVTSGAAGQPLPGHTDAVLALATVRLADGRTLLATGSQDTTARLWDIDTGRPASEPLIGHTDAVSVVVSVPASGDTPVLLTTGADNVVRLWDPPTGVQMGYTLSDDRDWSSVVAAVTLPDGRSLLATFEDEILRLWDPSAGAQFGQPLTGHTDLVWSVAVVPVRGGDYLLASASDDETVRLWDPMTGKQFGQPLTGHTGAVRSVAVIHLPNGTVLLASGGADETVRLWDPMTGKQFGQPLTGHTGAVRSVAVIHLPNGTVLLASGGADETIRLWSIRGGRAHCTYSFRLGSSIRSLCAVGDSRLAVGLDDGVAVFRVTDQE